MYNTYQICIICCGGCLLHDLAVRKWNMYVCSNLLLYYLLLKSKYFCIGYRTGKVVTIWSWLFMCSGGT